MWEPRRLTPVRASTACYRDSFIVILLVRSDSSVDTVTGRGKGFFSSPQRPDSLWVHTASYLVVLRANSQGSRRPGHESDHSPPSSAKVENGEAIPPLPHTSSWYGAEIISHSGSLTSAFIFIDSSPSKEFVFWNITLRSPFKVNRRFAEISCLHLQCLRISQARNHNKSALLIARFTLVSFLAYSSTLKMEATYLSGT
jgi:hypothetical protein